MNNLPGTTPDYWEDALTLPRLNALREEWRKSPPVSWLVAAYMGYEPKKSAPVEELLALFPEGVIK